MDNYLEVASGNSKISIIWFETLVSTVDKHEGYYLLECIHITVK